MEKLRLFVLKSVANELKKPAKDEESGGKHPERMIENGRHPKRQRYHDQRYAKAMAKPVDRMSMAASVLGNPLFAAASTKHGPDYNPDVAALQLLAIGLLLRARPVRSQPLLRRKQKSPRGSRMDVAICRNFLMLAHVGIFQPECDDLAFFIDGKGSNQHHVTRQVGDFCVQVDQAGMAGPKECSRPQGACEFSNHLASIVDVKGLTINTISPKRLHSGSAGPDKSPNTAAAFRRANYRSAVVNMIGAAAGIARKNTKVLHGAVLPQERMRARTGVGNADNGAQIVDPMRFTGCAAKRAQILNVAAGP